VRSRRGSRAPRSPYRGTRRNSAQPEPRWKGRGVADPHCMCARIRWLLTLTSARVGLGGASGLSPETAAGSTPSGSVEFDFLQAAHQYEFRSVPLLSALLVLGFAVVGFEHPLGSESHTQEAAVLLLEIGIALAAWLVLASTYLGLSLLFRTASAIRARSTGPSVGGTDGNGPAISAAGGSARESDLREIVAASRLGAYWVLRLFGVAFLLPVFLSALLLLF
jgi:hypothetical protein